MSRAPQLEPAWLIGLLLAWSRRETAANGLGFYSVNPMLRDGIPCQARSYEPMGYGGAEVDAAGRAVAELNLMHRIAIMRYLRPWMIPAFDRELEYTASTRYWLATLRGALRILEGELR